MKIEFNLVQNIMDTLPIGYYLGRSIPIELKNKESSYYVPSEDKIVIGFKLIEEAFLKIADSKRDLYDIEEIVRGLVYHEISHVILTPESLHHERIKYNDIINIFEDERIEYLLKSFYMNTNFKRNVVFLNKLDEIDNYIPTNAREAFYSVVRFHKGKPDFIRRVANIIKNYSTINAGTKNKIKNHNLISYYVKDIIKLYNDIACDFEQEKKSKNQNNDSDANDFDMTNTKLSEDDISKKDLTDAEIDDIIQDLNIGLNIDVKSIVKKALNESVNQYYDPQLAAKLSQIINAKRKKTQTNGTAINSYSGRLNVRAVATRDDYKWWAQQNRAGHVKMYSKVHFNLFIDNSGSFQKNDQNMNKFIQSLNKIVNTDFDFDVITINTAIIEWPNTTGQIFSSIGGTRLETKIKEVIKRHTVPRANNYNIVLFDGDAHPDIVGSSNAFAFFNSPNSIIVTDEHNRKYIQNTCNSARVIVTDDYCKKFIDAILTLMERTL